MVFQVDVGDFLRLKACVLYTETENVEQPLIHVEVVAHVTQPELRSSEVRLQDKRSSQHLHLVVIMHLYSNGHYEGKIVQNWVDVFTSCGLL